MILASSSFDVLPGVTPDQHGAEQVELNRFSKFG
jgi:hypothetical protein